MDVEERAKEAIRITRKMLTSILDNPLALSFMSAGRCEPEELEDLIADILEYFEKTNPEEEG